MNHSMHTADRATHLKVVVAGLIAGIAIVTTALTVHLTYPDLNVQKPTTVTVHQPHPNQVLTRIAQR
ncbi:hypothetical protein SAMN05216330_11377 [Bradyrhizobium sp. Ghvi]|uniref:hypothetical protein n=1 Tax=Bradyrhizobium sp. Ghvi TaxID=1855319 RepID=UPI0008E32195|nr:hypothetical protein [Bradyrhizobium sp. Ghvi]SFQ00019.1 hypothetical protein SAMN05216330_11377 [Bradyrhizobium sp. Ghvi]